MKSSRKDENATPRDHLPAPRKQTTLLSHEPVQTVRVAVEQGARVYFASCRRIARFFNRPRR